MKISESRISAILRHSAEGRGEVFRENDTLESTSDKDRIMLTNSIVMALRRERMRPDPYATDVVKVRTSSGDWALFIAHITQGLTSRQVAARRRIIDADDGTRCMEIASYKDFLTWLSDQQRHANP